VPLEVKTASMRPTYKPFATVYYDPTQTHPQIGKAIVYYLPVGAGDGRCATPEIEGQACAVAVPGLTHVLSLSRVVGLPGDHVAIVNGHVVRNGQPVSEPTLPTCGVAEERYEPGCQYPKPITVPPESYYVLGDERAFWQEDSRHFGAVPQAAVVGTLLGS
jgi:signal peptidase I